MIPKNIYMNNNGGKSDVIDEEDKTSTVPLIVAITGQQRHSQEQFNKTLEK